MRRREFIGAGALATLGAQSGKSCIILVMTGGASQLDTFDPKPDAPSNIRGPFRAIRTSAPEIRISELLPNLAKQAHRFSLLRSMYCPEEMLHEEALEAALGRFRFDATEVACPAGLGGERYGNTPFGDACLSARLQIEAGVKSVTVPMFDTVYGTPSWDSHGHGPFSTMATLRDCTAPVFDRAASALIADLDERGLLESTLVVAMTEFGRTPRINPQGGRDHWPGCWTTLLAGGGIAGGQILGT